MTIDEQEVLRRFHRALVREIQASDPGHLQSPFTVAEIYQNLVPYRTHRDELGLEMNADYEYALLRLLAGEGDFLVMDSRTAREQIREELESPNPNTGVYRDFAAAEVRLNHELIEEALSGPDSLDPQTAEEARVDVERGEGVEGVRFEAVEDGGGVPASSEEAAGNGPAPAVSGEGAGEEEAPGGGPEGAPSEEEAEEVAESEMAAEGTIVEGEGELDLPPDTCPWCKENLPQRPGVRFCPFCGSNVRLVPCPACGEELELNWRFCVACGTEVAS